MGFLGQKLEYLASNFSVAIFTIQAPNSHHLDPNSMGSSPLSLRKALVDCRAYLSTIHPETKILAVLESSPPVTVSLN